MGDEGGGGCKTVRIGYLIKTVPNRKGIPGGVSAILQAQHDQNTIKKASFKKVEVGPNRERTAIPSNFHIQKRKEGQKLLWSDVGVIAVGPVRGNSSLF